MSVLNEEALDEVVDALSWFACAYSDVACSLRRADEEGAQIAPEEVEAVIADAEDQIQNLELGVDGLREALARARKAGAP